MPFPKDPLWPGKSAQQAWEELSCPLLSQDPWPGFLSLPTGQSSGRAGGRKDASRAWSLFTNRKWLLPVHPRERCCPAGSGSQAPARKVPRMPLLSSLQGPRGYPGATREQPEIPEFRFFCREVLQQRPGCRPWEQTPVLLQRMPSPEFFRPQGRHCQLLPLTLSLWGSRA